MPAAIDPSAPSRHGAPFHAPLVDACHSPSRRRSALGTRDSALPSAFSVTARRWDSAEAAQRWRTTIAGSAQASPAEPEAFCESACVAVA
jgi:hypothetical protein